MRPSAGTLLNGLAWCALAAVAVLALRAAAALGYLGLVLLGGTMLLAGTMATLNDDVPTWGVGMFSAAMERPRHAPAPGGIARPMRLLRLVGAVVLAIGAGGLTWQVWAG